MAKTQNCWSDIPSQQTIKQPEFIPNIVFMDEKHCLQIWRREGGPVCPQLCYAIEWDRIDTTPKLLEWVHHLCEKDWITPLAIHGLINAASKKHNLKIYNNA